VRDSIGEDILRLPTDEEEEQAARFRTYVNYLWALRLYLAETYADPCDLVREVVKSDAFRSIRGGRCGDYSMVEQCFRNAWFTEIQLHISAKDDELVPYCNHWAPVQLYYALYLAWRGFFAVCGRDVGKHHTTTLRTISSDIYSRPALFPHPWRTLCDGDPADDSLHYLNLPSGVTVERVSSLTSASRAPFWDSYTMFLRTTRERQIKQQIQEWKHSRKRKRIRAEERKALVDGISATSLFDGLYRLRIRSNYSDADSFLLSLEFAGDAREFNVGMRKLSWYTLLLIELLAAGYLGRRGFSDVVDSFDRYDLGGYSQDLVKRRWEIIDEALSSPDI
jgi:hypothetical protein